MHFPSQITQDRPALPARGALDAIAATVSFPRNAEIHAQGGGARHCYRILSGCVRTVKLMEDGRRQVNEFLFPGDWFGFEAVGEYAFAAEAVGPVVLHRFPRPAFDALAEREPAAARWLLDLAAAQLRHARDRMVTLGRRTATERIAGFLAEMAARQPRESGSAVALPMSRGDIADHLGLTIETVCRSLAQMRRDGAITLARSSFTIRSRAALHALASATRH